MAATNLVDTLAVYKRVVDSYPSRVYADFKIASKRDIWLRGGRRQLRREVPFEAMMCDKFLLAKDERYPEDSDTSSETSGGGPDGSPVGSETEEDVDDGIDRKVEEIFKNTGSYTCRLYHNIYYNTI